MRPLETPPPPDRFRIGDRWKDPSGVIRVAERWGTEGVCMRTSGAKGRERIYSHQINISGWQRLSWGGQP